MKQQGIMDCEEAVLAQVVEVFARCGVVVEASTLFLQALTHSSYANEQAEAVGDNERLEFLGDAVIELALSQYLYVEWPDMPEGELTKIRAWAVSEWGLAPVAQELGLGPLARLGRGEELSGGHERPALLADLFEALVGALYLEKGWPVASAFVVTCLEATVSDLMVSTAEMDAKSALQELLQERYGQSPVYEVVNTEGPDHAKQFRVQVRLDDRILGAGDGSRKKDAEQEAAREALSCLARSEG